MTRVLLAMVSTLALITAPALSASAAPALSASAAPAPSIWSKPSSLPFQAPDFARIKDQDFLPALERGIALQKAQIAAIANNRAAPSFDNTIVAMERAGQELDRVMRVFNALTSANTNDVLDAVDTKITPQLTALDDETTLNPKLFARIKALHDKADRLGLNPEQRRLLDRTYASFAHDGALLDAAGKAKLKSINGQLAQLSTQFSQMLTAGTREAALVVKDKAALAGLSEGEITAAAKAAQARNLPEGSYLLPLQNTTQQPQLDSLTDPATRRALFAASWSRSERGNAYDTRAIITKIAQLRAQKAKLLGYKNFSDYQLYNQMAGNGTTARQFMAQLAPRLKAAQERQVKEIAALIAKDGGDTNVHPADWAIYAARIQKQKLDFDPAAAKPYFEINTVMEQGVFYAANQLYGLTFKRRTDLPTYHPDIRTYTVFDQNGQELALFYWDPWKRDNKQGGAWMSNFVGQSKLLGTKPVVYNVENFAKPAAGEPELVSFDDVITMFHEFGHALHGMLSDQTYPGLSGTSTARDFVEFPSQFNENWATHPQVLAQYARHYQTGAAMPAAMVEKLKDLRRIDQGYELGEVVAAAMLDMDWHALAADAPLQDVVDFEAKALAQTGLDTAHVPPRYRSTYFRHIWGNGYASAYYAYLWTQMLDHDAYDWFEQHGGLTRANGDRFRQMVLSRGSSLDYAQMYRAFTGRDPSVQPMLRAKGLAD